MDDGFLLMQLRDCFTAGYTLPQYCIDDGIRKPLFVVMEANHWQILWEIHVQFSHDKRIQPKFVSLNGTLNSMRLSPGTVFDELKIDDLEEMSLNDCDKIFLLTTQRFNLPSSKVVYLDELTNTFFKRVYMEIPALHFLQRHPKVKFFFTNFTVLNHNPNNTAREKQILADQIPLAKILEKLKANPNGNFPTPYDEFGYSKKDLLAMLDPVDVKTNSDGSTTLNDNDNPLVRVGNGKRLVPNQPAKFKNRIYFMGGCSHFGTGAPFDKTIESYLQKMLNENHLPYRVENESQFFTYRYQDIFYNLNKLPLMPGDIIFVFFDNILSEILPSFDVSKTFIRPHNYGEIFVDACHVNERGYKILAEKYFDFLTANNFFHNVHFNYPAPPRLLIIVTAYLLGASRAA